MIPPTPVIPPERTILNASAHPGAHTGAHPGAHPATQGSPAILTLAGIAIVAAILHLGQEVFLPLAIAMLLTFALSPVAGALRNRGVPPLASVLAAVAVAFAAIGAFAVFAALQLSELLERLPDFQDNILAKIEGLAASGSGTGIFSRIGEMLGAINAEIGNAVPDADSGIVPPMPVEVIARQGPVDLLTGIIGPLVTPVATLGIVVVVVVFMLIEREEIRDRLIRLAGAQDLHRTTEMLEEAGGRVATYLLTQLLVNTLYAVPIGLGLWLLGVPNAPLWGMLTLVLRFIPYIGPVLAAAFPLFLAFAVSPDWSLVLWTAALFLAVELISSNVVEPWLYGSRTGLTPLAIIVAAIFWTWIWGPMGLVLSTPLTVCLVVLGRHLPQFQVFDILFGDEPVLAPQSRLYQRLLAGDPVESTARAEEALEDMFLADYYRDIGIPALLLGQSDHDRGVLTADQGARLAAAAVQLVTDLAPIVDVELTESMAAPDPSEGTGAETAPDGAGFRVLSVGGRSALDTVAATMLGQAMAAEGASVQTVAAADLAASRFGALPLDAADCVVLNFLNAAPTRASLLHVRRLKRAAPHLRVGVVIWQMPDRLTDATGAALPVARVGTDKLAEAEAIGADFVVTTMDAALGMVFSDTPPRPLPAARPRGRRPAARRIRAVA